MANIYDPQVSLPSDSGSPVIPGTAMPLPPNQAQNLSVAQVQPAAPDVGTFSTRLAEAADKLGINPNEPGSWAKSLVGAAQMALPRRPQQPVQAQPAAARIPQDIFSAAQNVLGGLGDVAAVGTVPPGGGALTGISRTLAARGQRLSQQETDRILHAETQARTIALMRNIYRQDQEDRLASYKQGADFMNQLKTDHEVQENITQDELTNRVKTDPNFAHDYIVKPVGEQQLFDADGKPMTDQNGNTVHSPLYSIASIKTKTGDPAVHQITADDSAYLKRNTGVNLPEGTNLDMTRWNLLYTQAHAAQDVSNAIQKANDDQLSEDTMRNVRSILQNDLSLQHYTMMVPGYPLVGLRTAAQNIQAHLQDINGKIAVLQQKPGNDQAIAALQQQKQQFIDEGGKIGKVITFGFTDQAKKEADDYQLKVQKQSEEERHNKAEESNKRTELAQKKQQTIVSNLTGDDYLQTLPTQQQAVVRAVGEGRQNLPANRKEALALLEMVHQAYPDFDETKTKTWQKANNEYRGSGKTATQIVPAYNTALEHMQDLYGNTTAEGIFNPLSKQYQDREVALGYVAREVGKAVSAGAMTQKEGDDLLSTLKGGLTPALKRERITKTAQLLHDKIDEFQTKFNESAPSSAVKVPTLISPKAAQSYDFVTSGGPQAQQTAGVQTQPGQIPAGARPVIVNGKTIGYTTDGKTMLPLGAQ